MCVGVCVSVREVTFNLAIPDFVLWHFHLKWRIGFLYPSPSMQWYITLSSDRRGWEVKPYRCLGWWRTGPWTHYQYAWSLSQGLSFRLKMRTSRIFRNKHNGGCCLTLPQLFPSESEWDGSHSVTCHTPDEPGSRCNVRLLMISHVLSNENHRSETLGVYRN